MNEPEEDDDLQTARGVAVGVVLGGLLWLLAAAVVVLWVVHH
jgi:hypothetical protein